MFKGGGILPSNLEHHVYFYQVPYEHRGLVFSRLRRVQSRGVIAWFHMQPC